VPRYSQRIIPISNGCVRISCQGYARTL
jgi:hypothetical protein